MTFQNSVKLKIKGLGSIGNPKLTIIENVLFVDGLKHNLLSINPLCDKGFNVQFKSTKMDCEK